MAQPTPKNLKRLQIRPVRGEPGFILYYEEKAYYPLMLMCPN